ncbi:MAG: hypothetical protein HY704_03635 [Gemmatimonadetes bacterium]|nr:hypothetical protein [Gemmatimonadota bacterium]
MSGILLLRGARVVAALIMLMCVGACEEDRPPGVPPAAPRFVVVSVPMGSNTVETRMSPDGIVWTQPVTLRDQQGNPGTASTAAGIATDGTLYHAAWFDASWALRYATSVNGEDWLVSSDALGRFPVNESASPAVAAGGGKVLIAFRTGTGALWVVDITAPSTAVTLPERSGMGPGLAFGDGRFVLSYVVSLGPLNPAVKTLTSTDGATWVEVGQVFGGGVPPALSFADGRFHLVPRTPGPTRELVSVRIQVYSSTDGQSWNWERELVGHPSAVGTAIAAAGVDQLVLETTGGTVSAIPASGAEQTLGWTASHGISLTRGPGRRLATFRLERVTVDDPEDGGGDEPYFLVFGFKSRFGRPNSSQVTWSGFLRELGSDVGVGASVEVPPRMGAVTWSIEPEITEASVRDTVVGSAQVDVVGAAVVAIDGDGCPLSIVKDLADRVPGLLRSELENLIAGSTLRRVADIPVVRGRVDAARQRVLERVNDRSFWDWVQCGFDPEDLIDNQVVALVGWDGFPDGEINQTFALRRTRPDSALTLSFRNTDMGAAWTAQARVTYR